MRNQPSDRKVAPWLRNPYRRRAKPWYLGWWWKLTTTVLLTAKLSGFATISWPTVFILPLVFLSATVLTVVGMIIVAILE